MKNIASMDNCDSGYKTHRPLVTFTVQGPMVWNSLPDDLHAQQDYESFRQRLKTWLFSSHYCAQCIRDFVTIALFTFTIPYHLPY